MNVETDCSGVAGIESNPVAHFRKPSNTVVVGVEVGVVVGDVVGVDVGVVVGLVVGEVVGVVISHPTNSPYKCETIISLISVARAAHSSVATASTSPKQSMLAMLSDAPTGPRNSDANS